MTGENLGDDRREDPAAQAAHEAEHEHFRQLDRPHQTSLLNRFQPPT